MDKFQETLENIFTEAAKVFGKDESENLLKKIFETPTIKVIQTEVVEKKNKGKKEKSTKVEGSRMGRMTKAISSKLKSELVKAGVIFSDNETNELADFNTKYKDYINTLSEDEFKTGTATGSHIRKFAEIHKPSSSKADVSVEVDKNKAVVPKMSNAAHIEDLTIKQLQAIENIMTPIGGKKGVYWDCDKGRWVTGPETEDDEDATDITFQGKSYAVGDKTGRVYETTDNKDTFVGFVGVGAFLKMTI